MDGIRIGDRFRELDGSPRYGPKEWRLEVIDRVRTWIEIPMSEGERDFARMEDSLWWDSHSTWCRTPPVTQDDIDNHNLSESNLDGFAVFPAPVRYPPDKSPEAEAARVKAEGIWMTRYKDMESRQTVILPPDKPSEVVHRYHPELKRGD